MKLIRFFCGKNLVNNIDEAGCDGNFGNTGAFFLFLFSSVIDSKRCLCFCNCVCCLYECPSEKFSTTGFWEMSFAGVFSRLFEYRNDSGIPAEFSFIIESGDGMDICDEIAGKNRSDAGDTLKEMIFIVPVCFGVSDEFLIYLVGFLF